MPAYDVRKNLKQGTYYIAFETHREHKEGLTGEGGRDDIIGKSPTTRWVMRAVDYSMMDAAYTINTPLPRNVFATGRAFVAIVTPFNGTGADTAATYGTGTDPNGFMTATALDLTSAAGTVVTQENGTAALADLFAYWQNESLELLCGTAASTAGEAILGVELISYSEDIDADF